MLAFLLWGFRYFFLHWFYVLSCKNDIKRAPDFVKMGAFKKTFKFVLDFQCILYYTVFNSKKEGVHTPLEASVRVTGNQQELVLFFMYLNIIIIKCQSFSSVKNAKN